MWLCGICCIGGGGTLYNARGEDTREAREGPVEVFGPIRCLQRSRLQLSGLPQRHHSR